VVFGDVNATCACSITAKKEHVKLAHVEAGLRSFDMDMPEEVNRLVTDRLSDLLFTPDEISSENLRREGVPEERIHMVGNIMIDTLEANRAKAQALSLEAVVGENTLPGVANDGWHMQDDGFTVVTLHRPSNVDDPAVLGAITAFLCDEVASKLPLVWPVHPRTQDRLKSAGLWEALVAHDDVVLLAPVGYHSMLRLTMGARVMLTDSGGLQEECCVLGTPCLTMRWNTERPVTLAEHGGASVLVGNDVGSLREAFGTAYAAERSPQRPELWDGHTASRVLRSLLA
jgi:UDP-N-acetylglucosamine 2-epimerase (non-hydrolysing)